MSGGGFVIPAETQARQRLASDPATSAWVSANAGSGKTFVLTRRVVRILLSGTPASRILCLTFTKAAAATMSNRIFAELAKWVRLDDATLAAALADYEGGDGRISASRLAAARRLFAEAIETPGGLKIQTIHAFCESILQQFPLEADLGGNFAVLDERREREMIDAARAAVLVDASSDGGDREAARALAGLIDTVGEARLTGALGAVIAARDELLDWLRQAGDFDGVVADLHAALGVAPGTGDDDLAAAMLVSPDFPAAELAGLAADFAAGSTQDGKQAERIGRARDPSLGLDERVAAWRAVFFTAKDEPKAARSLATKGFLDRRPDFLERAGRETARLGRLADARAALATIATTTALLTLGDRTIGRYEAAKRASGTLDFDDLVGRTADLLSRSDAARWVQYKLDHGIDHVLIDEAQDSNPRQWRIVRGLTEEFFAGEGARRTRRTVFAVGDEKQSIYSFQGAAPDTFSSNRRHFRAAVEAAGLPFENVALARSFRSTTAVLSAVDRVFDAPELRGRILADPADYTAHTAARERAPGRVEVWAPIVATRVEEPEEWSAPLDRAGRESPAVRLAGRIADEIARLLAPGVVLAGTGEAVRPKDVLILVRKRGAFVEAMNRVLKERGIAVAGQDRLRLTDHVAIADLLALGRAMTTPEDDLTLAALLKSPLLERDDDDLIRLAALEREGGESLAAALDRLGATDAGWSETAARLARFRELAARLPTYEFFARVLSAEGGRRRFVARLGSEADDVLDEFLALALEADSGPAPSLLRFVEGLTGDPPEIKRALDESRDEVRVMTVHGAKGLEAAVVFLVDPGSDPVHAAHDPALVRLTVPGRAPGHPAALVWSRGAADPEVVTEERTARRTAAEAEYLRLLYVAMTRAADRLIVCGHAGVRGPSERSWLALVTDRLTAAPETIVEPAPWDAAETRLVWTVGPGEPVTAATAPAAGSREAATALPDWIERPAPQAAPVRRLGPSAALAERAGDDGGAVPAGDALAAAERPGERERQRGLLTHRLLEVLPTLAPEAREAAARRFLAARGAAFAAAEREAILAEVAAILDDATFAAVFAPGARAEVAIAGRLTTTRGETVEVSGRIDRLAVEAERILIVDFKTDRAARASEAHLAQMALYRRLAGEIWPGRRIVSALLWTAVPRLEPLDEAALERAARRLALS